MIINLTNMLIGMDTTSPHPIELQYAIEERFRREFDLNDAWPDNG